MADQSRQIKLAAAKKKLKEFQQKSAPSSVSAGPKKKRKVKGASQADVSSTDRHSPDQIENILNVMVSDLSLTNGVALPPLVSSQDRGDVGAQDSPLSQMQEDAPSAEPALCSPVSNTSAATNSECVADNTALQNCDLDANGDEHGLEENRPLSSTESLRQLSQQLNGLLSESPSSYVNGDSGPLPINERELETRNQELAAALDSSTLTNSQLAAKIETLTKQSQELSDQLQKERKEFEQKFAKEQGAMREQLQVHIQTIGILVSEKSELQTALSYTQQAARQKTGEAEELNNRLQSSKQRVSELERTLSTVSTQQKQFEKQNKDLEKERDGLRLEVFRLNNVSEEMKQQSSELAEQLKLKMNENSTLSLELDDLRKRLEMADVMLQQFSNQSDPSSEHQQLQLLLEEKHQLEVHTAQLMESIAQLQRERDQYAEQIQEEGRVWKDKTEQLLSQVSLMSEERDRSAAQIQELQEQIMELKNAAALSQEQETQAVSQSSGPSERELILEENLCSLQEEREALSLQYQAQVRDNEQLSRLVQEQETRLEELERQADRASEEAQDKLRILEDVQSDKATISRALTQNRELKDQLAELQNGFVKLTNENMELTSALQSEQHIKKEIARKMGQLQENLHNAKEQLLERTQECSSVQEQRDQYLAHLQQYSAGYQQLATEREHLHKQFLQQTQLMDRLQHDEVQGKVQLEQSQLQLQEAQERLDQLVKDNEQLKTEVQELLNSSALNISLRDQGDGVESHSLPESFQKSSIAIPEDFESREEMEEFLHSALSHLEGERDEVMRRLEEERRLHQAALQQVAAMSHEHHHHSTCSEMGNSDGVPVEVHEAQHFAMERLQDRFTALMQEKADLKERVDELEHRCIQLSGETDTIGEYIALYQNQRAIMKQKHLEKEQYINMLAKDKEEMKAKLAELQDLVMRLVGERNEWYTRYMSAIHNPDFLHAEEDFVQPAERRMELNAVDSSASMDMSTAVDLAPDSQARTELGGMAPSEGTEPPVGPSLRPREDGTARQIMQLLQEIQNPQARPAPFLGEKPCIPFFYRPDENDEVKIMVV
ncbi:golgin subfamily A member 2 isoform X2 [Pygocentrus nattereri]|uniref:Golgin subfamily A conserved domain-containing protein n=1 Tax=Pygocentrus nattereri TaxID=42514 RepID=A0A3B4C8X5_PYGNA|nr:golgin subfamily A member 2 isoform X2 [Pygocentrus nattereri]